MDGTDFTIFFEDPFWVGVLVSERNGRRFVNRFVFGSEPTNAELIAFMRDRFSDLLSGASEILMVDGRFRMPGLKTAKRGMREAARDQRRSPGKALHAYHEAFEKKKKEGRSLAAEKESLDEVYRFEMKKLKRKRARRGK